MNTQIIYTYITMEDDPFGGGDNTQMESTNQDDFFGGNGDVSNDNLVAEANFVDDDEEYEEDGVFDEVTTDVTPQQQTEEPVHEPEQQQQQQQAQQQPPAEEECTKLVEWRKQWREQLEEKATKSQNAKEARREAAKKELEAMDQMREKAREAKFEKNRSDQLKFLEEIEAKNDVKNPWEAVISLIDLKPKSDDDADDRTRMKNLLIQMKGATSGPGIPEA